MKTGNVLWSWKVDKMLILNLMPAAERKLWEAHTDCYSCLKVAYYRRLIEIIMLRQIWVDIHITVHTWYLQVMQLVPTVYICGTLATYVITRHFCILGLPRPTPSPVGLTLRCVLFTLHSSDVISQQTAWNHVPVSWQTIILLLLM